eukprot:Amastigsp_a509634_467.p2 type:complete len:170 gc:universal Amastigsp_a509634_467:780-271(-)
MRRLRRSGAQLWHRGLPSGRDDVWLLAADVGVHQPDKVARVLGRVQHARGWAARSLPGILGLGQLLRCPNLVHAVVRRRLHDLCELVGGACCAQRWRPLLPVWSDCSQRAPGRSVQVGQAVPDGSLQRPELRRADLQRSIRLYRGGPAHRSNALQLRAIVGPVAELDRV